MRFQIGHAALLGPPPIRVEGKSQSKTCDPDGTVRDKSGQRFQTI